MTATGFRFEMSYIKGRWIVCDLTLPFHQQYIGYVDRRGTKWMACLYDTRPLVDEQGDELLFRSRSAAALALRAEEVKASVQQ